MRSRHPARNMAYAITVACALLTATNARARDDGASVLADCADGRVLEHGFDSGAAWSACARIDDVHGLELRDVSYRAPGDTARPVLRSLHVAQLLLHWHDRTTPERQLDGTRPLDGMVSSDRRLGGAATRALDATSCDGTPLAASRGADAPTVLCTRERASGLLAKYAQRRPLNAERYEVFAVARQGLLIWRIGVTLTEDGQIVPSVTLSGRAARTGDDPRFGTRVTDDAGDATRLTHATLLTTWRLRFALDTPASDLAQELDFPLVGSRGGVQDNRRPMQVRALDREVFRPVAPPRFRGWRVFDPASGAGYTLDPLDGGRRWNAPGGDWSRFELAVTRARGCERHAEANDTTPARADDDMDGDADAGSIDCGRGLDDFVDGEILDGADPVLWFSRTRLLTPRREDLPFLSSVRVDMRIAPFDWTASSPFEETR